MKIRNIIVSLAAAVLAAACTVDEPVSHLDGLDVSNDYMTLASDEGSNTSVTVTSDYSWTAETKADWISLSPASGTAGSSVDIYISATSASTAERTAEINIVAGDMTKIIIVKQAAPEGTEAAPSTCKEIVEGPDITYRVTGVITKISNTHYGNWYINDGTIAGDGVYVYGTLDKKGGANSSSNSWDNINDANYANSWELAVGDEVTIEGPKTVYNGTVELVDVTIVSITKSLLSVKEESYNLPKEGGEALVKVVYKGNDLQVQPKADWISLGSVNVTKDTTFVTLKVAQNTGDPRTGEVSFASSITGQASAATVSISQAGVSGTLATPFTVAQAIDYCNALGSGVTSEEQFYIKGKVSRIANNGAFGAQYGNGTFWISEDGEFHGEDDKTADKSLDFEVYRALWFNNQKWVDGNVQIEVGDEVIICGNLTNYNGLAETASGKNYIYSINGVTDNMTGNGTVESPFNVPAAISLCNRLGTTSSEEYYVKGKVSKVVYTFSASYGTGTFWISDNGEYANDLAKDFEAYSVYWFNNKAWVDGDGQIAVGDEVVLHGLLTYYKGTAETSSKKAYVYSQNGKTE